MSEERAYDWDETIEQPSEGGGGYTLFEPGTYRFSVKTFERGRHNGSDKLPPCNKAIITLEVNGGPQGVATIQNNFFLHSKCEGLLASFFTAIGDRKHGDPLVMNWPGTLGKDGYVKIKHRTHDGKTYNDVQYFLDDREKGAKETKETLAALKPATSAPTQTTDDDEFDWETGTQC